VLPIRGVEVAVHSIPRTRGDFAKALESRISWLWERYREVQDVEDRVWSQPIPDYAAWGLYEGAKESYIFGAFGASHPASDLAAVVAAAASAERWLKSILQSKGTFEQLIDELFSRGWTEEGMKERLHRVRRMRNDLVHFSSERLNRQGGLLGVKANDSSGQALPGLPIVLAAKETLEVVLTLVNETAQRRIGASR
jgi:hypothetical protein